MSRYEIIVYHHWSEYLTLEQLAQAAEVHPELVQRLVEFELLEPVVEGGRLFFEPDAVERLRLILRLRSEVGVGLSSVAVILNLTDKIRILQHELEWYRNQF